MLVYAKNPRGVLHINGFQIYGKETGRDPCDIPFDLYNSCKDGLQDATYREGVLNRLFAKSFPAIAFTYSELKHLPEQTIDTIGTLIVDTYDTAWSHKKKVDQIKKRIADESPAA